MSRNDADASLHRKKAKETAIRPLLSSLRLSCCVRTKTRFAPAQAKALSFTERL
jgi:hypothetical protein